MNLDIPFHRALLFGGLALGVTVIASALMIVLIPRGFLTLLESKRKPAGKKGLVRRIARNAVGWILIVVGVVLSLPGIPGPGVLVLLIGLFLVDFPGKTRLQRKILGSPAVARPANRLRRLFGKAPLELPHSP